MLFAPKLLLPNPPKAALCPLSNSPPLIMILLDFDLWVFDLQGLKDKKLKSWSSSSGVSEKEKKEEARTRGKKSINDYK